MADPVTAARAYLSMHGNSVERARDYACLRNRVLEPLPRNFVRAQAWPTAWHAATCDRRGVHLLDSGGHVELVSWDVLAGERIYLVLHRDGPGSETVVSHGYKIGSARDTVLPCESLRWFQQRGAKRDEATGEWFLDAEFAQPEPAPMPRPQPPRLLSPSGPPRRL